jgi:hypothetical protein
MSNGPNSDINGRLNEPIRTDFPPVGKRRMELWRAIRPTSSHSITTFVLKRPLALLALTTLVCSCRAQSNTASPSRTNYHWLDNLGNIVGTEVQGNPDASRFREMIKVD